MKIAMIGHKDFPCRSGGVEVVVYELATRLAQRGEDVTVYNRGKQKGHNKYDALGVHVVRSFTLKKQSVNAMIYSFTATIHALFRHYDVIHYHAIGPSVPLVLAHLFGKRTVATVHGLNWRGGKWGSFASRYLKLGEKVLARYADEVVTLSEEMHQYFLDTYGRDTALVKNAISIIPPTDDHLLREAYGLEKGSYILYIGRLSPEKGPQDLIAAYKRAGVSQKLVIAGEMPDNDFGRELTALIDGDENIVLPGFVSGDIMHALYSSCALYVLPSHTEGLSLSLLEALSIGARCLVSDIPENTVVTDIYGAAFKPEDTDDLARALERECTQEYPDAMRQQQIQYIHTNFEYDVMLDRYEEVYHHVVGDPLKAMPSTLKKGRVPAGAKA